jgi:uncharacterized LabA/DUF88 family protein
MTGKRVSSYIDGFNLYYGLREAGLRRFYWLDVVELSRNLLKSGQKLATVHYFTSRVSGGSPSRERSRRRQKTLLEAYETLPNCDIHYGHYLQKQMTCRSCKAQIQMHEEKRTDVNIAVELLAGAFGNEYDTAIVVSGDSDLAPAIEKVKLVLPEKRVLVAFPPRRSAATLKNAAHGNFQISRQAIRKSQLPEQIQKPDGTILLKPKAWV